MSLCLVVEDDGALRQVLGAVLRSEGYEVAEAADAAQCRSACASLQPEVVILDLGLPDADGLGMIEELVRLSPLSRIVVLTGLDSVSAAVAALRAGARHYLVKPWDETELLLVVEREAGAVDLSELRSRRNHDDEVFWGNCRQMTELRHMINRVARSPLTPVLVEGETGTGKEIVAREIHSATAPKGPFVALNCASIPTELMESELFGHERGAFTGAESRRRGLAELAKHGTLFLDEIGELTSALQPKLLRFLQDHRFRRVGGEEEISSPCRIIAATHHDLEAAEKGGSFRSDLFFRLSVVRLRVPPLRDRGEDLLTLAYFLMSRIASAVGCPTKQLSSEAERAIQHHPWRGNVRELRNRLERALVLSEDPQIHARDLDLVVADADGDPVDRSQTQDIERDRLRGVLRDCGWNVSRAARSLGVPRHWLRYRMKKHGLQPPSRGPVA